MNPAWEPANETERVLAAAIDTGDAQAFAKIMLSAPLYLPALPGDGPVLAFTSVATMRTVINREVDEYHEADVSTLAGSWQDPERELVINPGLPIGAAMPPKALIALAEGGMPSIPLTDLRAAIVGELKALIRKAVLDELGDGALPADAPPENELERRLAGADAEEVLDAILFAEVVVPVTGPLPEPGRMDAVVFPWRTITAGELRAIPMFSSPGAMDRACAGSPPPWVWVSFLDALSVWPEEDHGLCLNPGSPTEMILPGDAVDQLIDGLAASLADAMPDPLED